MAKWTHRLSGLKPESRTAICAECGPVDVISKSQGPGRPRRWVCGPKRRKDRRKFYDSRSRMGRGSHGLTPEEAQAFKAGKACAVCGILDELCVDHDHGSGQIRGVLCRSCNLALGYLKDDVDRIYGLASYMEAQKNTGAA